MRRSPAASSVPLVHAFTACLSLALLTGCGRKPPELNRLPTGLTMDPVGHSIALGSMPVAMIDSPDSSRIVAVLSGYREQGLQVIDRATRRVVQTLVQPAAFVGAAFSHDGRTLFASGGDRDVIYRYAWRADTAALVDSIMLGPGPGKNGGRAYPAGLACSADGTQLYVAENLADSLAVIDLASGRMRARFPTGRYPYGVVVAPDGRVFVSAWGGSWVASYRPSAGSLLPGPRIEVGRHPSSLLLDRAGTRLYVTCASSDRIAVVDTKRDSVVAVLRDSAPGGPAEGSTPDGLALSPDGRRLYVAEADNNAVAIFDLSAGTSGLALGVVTDSLIGRIPVEWYPTAVLVHAGSLAVLNGKGRGAGPNPTRSQPGRKEPKDQRDYTLGQTSGSLSLLPTPADVELVGLSQRVAVVNGWDHPRVEPSYPPFKHVVYIIRENRTYDQVFGDLAGADGDTSLTYFPRAVTPNAHALAERFGIFDRFLVNAEVSGDGHNWSTAAYAADYVEKTIPSTYSGRGRSYDYEGSNRDVVADDDVNEPANGYLWDLAQRAGVSLKNYGEFTLRAQDGHWIASKPWLSAHTAPGYPGWDLAIRDTLRAGLWIREFNAQVAGDSLPALTLLRLPNDHTAGARAGSPTPRAYMADNDLALGRVIEALSRSPYWKNTVVFVLEDDAQDGPDHVDSHRSLLLMISAYNKRGVWHQFANTSDVIATIDRILRLSTLSKFDHFGRPIDGVFSATPDTSAYAALVPSVPLDEINSDSTHVARLSRRLDLRREDQADMALFNRILWMTIKGRGRAYPGRAGRSAEFVGAVGLAGRP